VSDVLGVESLVGEYHYLRKVYDSVAEERNPDIMAFKRTALAAKKDEKSSTNEASHSAILGPFYRHGVPVQPNGTTIVRQFEKDADYTRLFGTVYDSEGKPLKGAMVDVWHDVSLHFNLVYLRGCC
jgi:catechol 1,2-dioxygenase